MTIYVAHVGGEGANLYFAPVCVHTLLVQYRRQIQGKPGLPCCLSNKHCCRAGLLFVLDLKLT